MSDHKIENIFFATGQYHWENQSIQVNLSGRYISYSQDPVKIQVWSDDHRVNDLFDNSMRYPYHVWFEGKTDNGKQVLMQFIKPTQISGQNHLEATVGVFIFGDLYHTVKPENSLFIHAKVTAAPFIVPEITYSQNFDGTITKVFDEKKRSGINWKNSHGEVRLIDNYEYTKSKSDDDVLLRIKTNSLFFTFQPNKDIIMRELLLDLPMLLLDDLNLLSFIGRKRIVCTEASIRLKSSDAKITTEVRYHTWPGFYNLPAEQGIMRSLIVPKFLQEGVFDTIFKNYSNCKFKNIIERTIPYLITSYEDGYQETHLINAYAALESMVNGIGKYFKKELILNNNEFRNISKKIRELIRGEFSDKQIVDDLLKKIPELKRRSFLDIFLFLLREQDVNSEYIWPPNIDEREEWQNILKRRHLLIHSGKINPGNICTYDLNRVQKLVELWILRLIDCPYDAINKYSFWRNAPIHKILHQ